MQKVARCKDRWCVDQSRLRGRDVRGVPSSDARANSPYFGDLSTKFHGCGHVTYPTVMAEEQQVIEYPMIRAGPDDTTYHRIKL